MKPISLNLEIIIESELWNNPPVSSKFLETSALNALRLGSDDLTSPCEINLLLCDDAKIQSLNKSWREQDKPTNVLSFPAAYVSPDGNDFLGDIAIAYETVEREAKEEQKTLQDHLAHLVIHGVLHLLGFDHIDDEEAEEMEELERLALAEMGIANPYKSI